MASSENELDPFEEIRLGRARMEWEWRFRQENLLPLETAYNVGRFYGLLLKGGQPLRISQRVGILSMAVMALLPFTAVFFNDEVSLAFSSDRFRDLHLARLLSTLPYVLVGMRLVWIALKPNSPRRGSLAQR